MMMSRKDLKIRLKRAFFRLFFGIIGIFMMSMVAVTPTPVYAEEPILGTGEEEAPILSTQQEPVLDSGEDTGSSSILSTGQDTGSTPILSTQEEGEQPILSTETDSEAPILEPLDSEEPILGGGDNSSRCKATIGGMSWIACEITEKISVATDWLYERIEKILVIKPVISEDGSTVYDIWKYCRDLTNYVFIIFLLIVIYSQITGLGISNYGIKKALPKIIVAAILVNLSFLICQLAVDVSNIVGDNLRGVFSAVEKATMPVISTGGSSTPEEKLTMARMYASVAGVVPLVIGVVPIVIEAGTIWMLIPVALGALFSVAIGLVTIAIRQAVVILLIMISPLAIVAYMLPNTEGLFKKWKALLTKMLVFYPMFSLLFGASSLAGYAIIASATDGFWVLLGLAVQIFPLFFAWKMMEMSGTFLGAISSRLRMLTTRPMAATRSWADSKRAQTRANTIANGTTPSARLLQYLEYRRSLREEDTKNLMEVAAGKTNIYVQRKLADSEIGDTTSSATRTSRYTKHAKAARNYSLMSKNATAFTDHVMVRYGEYFNNDNEDRQLSKQSAEAWKDYGRSVYQKEVDDEDDIGFLVNQFISANERDEYNNPKNPEAFRRYVSSVVGPNGDQRLIAKVITQAARVESKQRGEYGILLAKYGHNGYNKDEFRHWLAGYLVNDDGWAIDENGKRLKNDDGSYVETIQGDAITKAPERLVRYDKRDENGLYFDMKDQDGNVVARVHRKVWYDAEKGKYVTRDDSSFIKEVLSNYDIPISDPINNIYGILSGIAPGDSIVPEIGLAKYSTTIGRALSAYKGDASWSGSMFNAEVGNRQIRNSAEYALAVLDSIKKTLKPGAFNTQNPASVAFIRAILNPDNWSKIFTEDDIKNAVNINNELVGGEDWLYDDDGNLMTNEKGDIAYRKVEDPNYEQRMNTIKRKLIFPAMKKIIPAFDRLRTSNTADNQKPGTADESYEFLKMIEEKWENNPDFQGVFDPTLVNQDLPAAAREFRQRKHDRDGNLLYGNREDTGSPVDNLLNVLEETFARNPLPEELVPAIATVLSRDEYNPALIRFEQLCAENPVATADEIRSWFDELASLV